MLIKRSDENALSPGSAEPVDTAMASVISGRTNTDLAKQGTLRPDHKARARKTSATKPSTLARVKGARKGIRAFSVNPGAVETPLLRSNFPEKVLPHAKTLSPEAVARVALDCIAGRRDADRGKTIPVPSP